MEGKTRKRYNSVIPKCVSEKEELNANGKHAKRTQQYYSKVYVREGRDKYYVQGKDSARRIKIHVWGGRVKYKR